MGTGPPSIDLAIRTSGTGNSKLSALNMGNAYPDMTAPFPYNSYIGNYGC
jgi:hypothetical protein